MERLSVRPRGAVAPRPFASPAGVEMLEPRRLLHSAPHDPVMQAEHQAMLALVPDEAVTNAAVQSGAWSDPATWAGAALPAEGANVLVPAGMTVTVDAINSAALRTVRVDGTLGFATAVNTQLAVDTLVVTPDGTLVIGTAADPVRPDVTARVVFADRGPIDTVWDPRFLSRGLIAHGTTSIYGSPKSGFGALSGPATKGSRTLVLAEAPENWAAGDEIVLAGTSATGNQDEKLTVLAVEGRFVRVDRPLAFTHAAPQPDLPVYAADLTRNVVFSSQNQQPGAANVARRGHVMFMHAPTADINNAAFAHLGRTDKSARINDPRLDDFNQLVPGTGTNPRGRYALHFHRTGVEAEMDPPASVRGCVVDGGVGWGFVNHSSDVIFEDDVSYDVYGAGFVAEAGDEIGAFRHNFALRSAGSGESIEGREDVQDFGHEGEGFWFQGGGVEVEDNVAAGQRRAGFVYFTRGLDQAGVGVTRFPSENLPDASIAGGQAMMAVGDVPIRLFRNNYAYACGDGFESWFQLLGAKHSARSVVEGFTTWGNRTGKGVFIPYTRHMTLRKLRALGSLRAPAGRGIDRNDVTEGVRVENAQVEGFEVGFNAPKRGANTVRGGVFNNLQNVYVNNAAEPGRSVDVAAVRFGYLSPAALNGREQYDVYFKPADLNPAYLDLPDVFGDDAVRVNGRQVFRSEQAADFVPYPAGAATTPYYVPPEMLDQSNRQLWDQYGLAVGGAVASDDASDFSRPRTNGLVGDPAPHLPTLRLDSRKYTNHVQDYQLVYTPDGGTEVKESQPSPLREGWNLLTRTIGGRPRTFLIYGDVTPPTLMPMDPLVINPLALARGLTVQVPVYDASIGQITVTRTFTDLLSRPVQTRPDGTQFITLDFRTSDLSGNVLSAVLEVTLDPAAPL